jgi:6-phosphofructokinase 1
MELPNQSELEVTCLGKCTVQSPLVARDGEFIDDNNRILVSPESQDIEAFMKKSAMPPCFEAAGPRRELFFEPKNLTVGIVTCGGLCPGLNDVIRSLVMTLTYVYGTKRIIGFRYGYAGLTSKSPEKPMLLTPELVSVIHDNGGTLLGSSRGAQSPQEMVDTLVAWDVGILFTVGGDGTLRGASAIAQEVARRKLSISVIGVPKTIDNDIQWVQRSFGFLTAVEEARRAISAAHSEARGARNGIGMVKLMGRHSGFIAVSATLANPDVNYCLIPEVPFTLRGEGGFLPLLVERLKTRKHAVIVVAEGAGQELLQDPAKLELVASRNIELQDIGLFLKDEIKKYCREQNMEHTIKYIDPSYTIRSQPANSNDSSYCLVLAQHAVHAGMAGRTNMVVGFWNDKFTHMPISLATKSRRLLDPRGEEWQYLLQMTGQPSSMVGKDADQPE